jgi:hypothetical protein
MDDPSGLSYFVKRFPAHNMYYMYFLHAAMYSVSLALPNAFVLEP